MNSQINLATLLKNASALACAKSESSPSPARLLNRARSIAWVESVAQCFRDVFSADPHVRVFSKYCEDNRKSFGLNELLYDVAVCRVDQCAAYGGKTICFVKEALWQVESEFAADSQQAIFDFNKLVMGAAINKVFLGPLVTNPERFLDVLLPAARCCTGNVYAALLAHPKDWCNNISAPEVWHLEENSWKKISAVE